VTTTITEVTTIYASVLYRNFDAADTLHVCSTVIIQQMPMYMCIDTSNAEWISLTLRQACSQEVPGSAMCVQNLDDSRGVAIRITYRISLRSSSLWEPRHPLLKVVFR
jgi:hypothetical protein